MMVPRQVAGVMRTCAKRRVMTVAIENMTAISRASPSPIGDTLPLKDSETMMATPQMTAKIATQVAGATFSPKQHEGEKGRNQRHAGLHQEDVGDRRVGQRDDEGGRGRGEAERDGEAGQAHVAEQPAVPAAVAQKHETEQERRGPKGAPEHDRPRVRRSMKRAIAPPKLQNSADRKTSKKPRRFSRRDTCGAAGMSGAVCCVARFICRMVAGRPPPGAPDGTPPLCTAAPGGVVQPCIPVVAMRRRTLAFARNERIAKGQFMPT